MKDRFHISKAGEPALCEAIYECPLKGEHFSTEAEAWDYYAEQNRESVFPAPLEKEQPPAIDPELNRLDLNSRSYDVTGGVMEAEGFELVRDWDTFDAEVYRGRFIGSGAYGSVEIWHYSDSKSVRAWLEVGNESTKVLDAGYSEGYELTEAMKASALLTLVDKAKESHPESFDPASPQFQAVKAIQAKLDSREVELAGIGFNLSYGNNGEEWNSEEVNLPPSVSSIQIHRDYDGYVSTEVNYQNGSYENLLSQKTTDGWSDSNSIERAVYFSRVNDALINL